MSEYPNSGALFKNDRKTQDNHPEYTGSAEINGRDYWLSAWVKQGQKGKFFSIAFKPKEDKPTETQKSTEDNDDVPF